MLLFLAFPVEHLCAGGTYVGVGASCLWLGGLLGERSLLMPLANFPGDGSARRMAVQAAA